MFSFSSQFPRVMVVCKAYFTYNISYLYCCTNLISLAKIYQSSVGWNAVEMGL